MSAQPITEKIIRQAMQKADAAQVTLLTTETSSVNFENDKLKAAESSQRTNIDIKVIVGGKVGVSSTTDPRDIDGLVSRALEAAEFGAEAHFEIPAPAELEPVKIFDPDLLPLEKPEMIRVGQQMMDMIKSYNPEILTSAAVRKHVTRVAYANSKGARYEAEHTDFSIGAGGQLVRGQDILFAGHGVGQKKRAVDTEEIAAQAIEYFRMAEQIVPIESGALPVIFTPSGLIALLLSLGMAIDGKNVLLGASPLRDKLGVQIADPRLTLIDDPFIEYGPNTSAFDDEGMPRKVTPLIENGVLMNFIYDLDTAGRAGAQPTGHGSRRQTTNLMIEPGDQPHEEMIKSIETGLLVEDFLGLGQGNPINGEFSVNVFLGYKIENGKVVGRVKDVMLAGNAFEALKDIVAISSDREWVSGPWVYFSGLMPYIQIGKLSVTAK
ncbi:MAG: TldD/PmbA family protein [Anaerolineales bacterium]|nr:TldD/PmbA family protein [Anaerolineales bacterium]